VSTTREPLSGEVEHQLVDLEPPARRRRYLMVAQAHFCIPIASHRIAARVGARLRVGGQRVTVEMRMRRFVETAGRLVAMDSAVISEPESSTLPGAADALPLTILLFVMPCRLNHTLHATRQVASIDPQPARRSFESAPCDWLVARLVMATLNANPIVYHQKSHAVASKRKVVDTADDGSDEDTADPWTAEEVFGQSRH
jgi:hypothetical protein